MVASSFTVSGSSVRVISSSRMDSAVSGVRSWWEASAASRRSAVSMRAIRSAQESRTSATRSSSGTPYRLWRGRGSPGAEPFRGLGEVGERGGQPVGLPYGEQHGGDDRQQGHRPMTSRVRPTSRVTVERDSSTVTVSPCSPLAAGRG